jgi:trimeric autotransporter adhesin
MERTSLLLCLLGGLAIASAGAQSTPAPVTPPPPSAPSAPATTATAATGGVVHGTVKAGNVPLPGVSVVATNTLTGQRYATITDINGNYSMNIPVNGRYVIKTELAAFAAETKTALIKPATATPANQQADFALTLASRVPPETPQQTVARTSGPASPRPAGGGSNAGTIRRNAGGGAQNLALMAALAGAGAEDTGISSGATGAALPSLANNSDFSAESVAVTGQAGSTNPFAGIDMEQLRQNAELDPSGGGPGAGGPGQGGPGGGGPGGGGPGGGGPGGGGFGGGGGGFGGGGVGGGGFGGRGGGRGGGGRGGFGNFRGFKPNQPHGAFFWTGGNSALNATPFPIKAQKEPQPSYAQNQFGLTFLGTPYIPHLIEHDTKDTIFLNITGQRSSSPFSQYGSVPTAAERTGDLSSLTTQEGTPVTIYDRNTGLPFPNNVIPAARIAPQATALLTFLPLPNLSGQFQNYQRLASSESNNTRIGVRFIHSFGNSPGGAMGGMIRQYLGQGGTALRQSMNVNFNYSHSAADELDLFPQLGGKQQSHQYSAAWGYTIGKGRITNNLGLNWNRSNSQLRNDFTGNTDIAAELGLSGLPTNPLFFGLPQLTLNQFTSATEQQPNFQINQTIAATESTSWIHKKHNFRFGGDFRRVHNDLFGNTGNITGTYTFTGFFTEQPGTSGTTGGGTSNTGSSLADLLLGLPQQTSIQAPDQKSYLRQNAWDAFAQDSWRARANLTLLFGLRYEYYSPYSEKYDRLSTLDTGNNFTSVQTVVSGGIGPYTGKYPRDLVYPEHNNFSPRLGIAVRVMKDTVVRAGYGINYAVGQYAKFIQDFAFQPPFANVQTNSATGGASQITLANGFLPQDQAPAEGNYAVNKYYRLPYVQVWNFNLQRTLPEGIVLNIGYNGSKGTRLDVVNAPGRTANASVSGVFYDYEQSVAFSNFNALTVSARNRLHDGIALGATYTYSHSIDNASSIGGSGGTGTVVAQNWQNLLAEESNSSFDVRNKVTGNFLYELPFGPDAHMLTTGALSHTLNGISLSGTFTFAGGSSLTPHYEATVDEVSRGTTASLRPDRVPGASLTAGGGSLDNWFNKSAFAAPANVYGTASRYSIPGPGTVSVNASFSKTVRFSETRTFEMRATASNVFNTVQYSGIDTTLGSGTYGEVTSAAGMRQFTFNARFRY